MRVLQNQISEFLETINLLTIIVVSVVTDIMRRIVKDDIAWLATRDINNTRKLDRDSIPKLLKVTEVTIGMTEVMVDLKGTQIII